MPEFEGNLAPVGGEMGTYDQLIAVANEIIELARGVDQATPAGDVRMGDLPGETEFALAALTKLKSCTAELNNEVDALEADLIVRARTFGLTWRTIGGSLGISGQGAYKKVHDHGYATDTAEE